MTEIKKETDGFIKVEVGVNSLNAERGDLAFLNSRTYIVTQSARKNSDPLTVGVFSFDSSFNNYMITNICPISTGQKVSIKKFAYVPHKIQIGIKFALNSLIR